MGESEGNKEKIGNIDLTPNPRVLRMLGQIEFDNWQCIAELIDNSIDAIMDQGSGVVGVSTPSRSEFDNRPDPAIKVWDDGPGMSPEVLEKALKAGYSGNDPLSKLGLFGMGFNISTARLGRSTEVRTTIKGENFWTSVTIDFNEMEKSGNYFRPLYKIKKSDPDLHGTIITITKLSDRVRTIKTQSTVKKVLSRIYSPILQSGKIKIVIDGEELTSRGLCVWGKNRYVERDNEKIPARIEINENLGKEYFCKNCWEWIKDVQAQDDIQHVICPQCKDPSSVIIKDRKLTGWVGIQRFFDMQNYGLDLIRNGRVIEPLSKSFFYWYNPVSGEKELEYPIDTTYWGGRIVGELHIDFVPITYMKDHFEKADKRWKEVERKIRGDGPLRPDIAKEHHYDKNNTPIGLLFSGYRTGREPGKKNLVPGKIDTHNQVKGMNTEILPWVEKYYQGDAEYLEDTKWWEAVEIAEMAKRSSGGSESALPVPKSFTPSSDSTLTKNEDGIIPQVNGKTQEYLGVPSEVNRFEKDPILSQEYNIDEIGEVPIIIDVYKSISGSIDNTPMKLDKKSKDKFEVIYDPTHPIFKGYNFEPLDLILLELSQVLNQRRDDPKEWPTSKIFFLLKKKYSAEKRLSPTTLSEKSNEMLTAIKKFLSLKNIKMAPGTISPLVIDEIRKNVLSRIGKGEQEVKKLLRTTQYINYAPDEEILNIFNKMPEIFFDSGFWNRPFKTLGTEQLQEEVSRSFSGYITDLLWLKKEAKDYDPELLSNDIEYRLQRAAFSLKLLEVYRE